MNNHYHLTSLQPSGSASMFYKKAQATAQVPTSGRTGLCKHLGMGSLSRWPTKAIAWAMVRLHQPRCKFIRLKDPPSILSLRIRDRLGRETEGVWRASSGIYWQHPLVRFGGLQPCAFCFVSSNFPLSPTISISYSSSSFFSSIPWCCSFVWHSRICPWLQ